MSSGPSQRDLITYPLAPSVRAKLTGAGFLTVSDLHNVKPSELSKESGLSLQEALEVLKIATGEGKTNVSSASAQSTLSALHLLEREQSLASIVTFCARLDESLGGGVALRKVTEICGAPGVGKTQMCIQLAVDVSIPEDLGGAGGEAVYIDTEGSFIVERVVDVAMATADHCQKMAAQLDSEGSVDVASYNYESILAGIHYFRCHDYVELLATIHLLASFIQQHPKVKLVVVDSIAFPFRHNFDDLSLRTRLLTTMAQSCIKLATDFSLAVVLTNQMTTRFTPGSSGSHLTPALGESWGHACTVRLVLYWQNGQRHAMLYKSPSHRETTVLYQITTGGVRDVVSKGPAADSDPENQPDETDTDRCKDGAPSKKQRLE